MPFACASGLLQAKGVRKYISLQCPSLALQACCKRRRVRKYISLQCPSLALQACCKRRACENTYPYNALRLRFRLVASEGRAKIHILTMPFACASGLLQAKGVRKYISLQCPSLALQACCKRLPRHHLHSQRRSIWRCRIRRAPRRASSILSPTAATLAGRHRWAFSSRREARG